MSLSNRTNGIMGRPTNKKCLQCNRKTVYPEKMFDEWFYPREQTCFDCLMTKSNRFDKIRSLKLPGKMNDTADFCIVLVFILYGHKSTKRVLVWVLSLQIISKV